MRIDSYDVNLTTGGDRFPVDMSLPPVPPEEGELDVSILVHDDTVDFAYARPAGMPPLHGRDEIEAVRAVGYEPGLDGPTAPPAAMAPAGLERDRLEPPAPPWAGRVAPFSVATAETDAVVRGNLFAPFLDPLAFQRGDAVEPPRRFAELHPPAPIGRDALETAALSEAERLLVRAPFVGRDEVQFPARERPGAGFGNRRDGLESPGRAALLLRI